MTGDFDYATRMMREAQEKELKKLEKPKAAEPAPHPDLEFFNKENERMNEVFKPKQSPDEVLGEIRAVKQKIETALKLVLIAIAAIIILGIYLVLK